MRYKFLLTIVWSALLLVANSAAQAPSVERVEPPSWYKNSSLPSVRVLVRGTGLQNATVSTETAGLKVSSPKSSANGHYLFFDVAIGESVRPGAYKIRATTPSGSVDVPFSVFEAQSRLGNYQGFRPDDVIYFIFTDRFADGDPANNDPAKSKGLFDRSKPRSYHGGDLQGIINNFDHIKRLGATAIWTTPIYDNNDRPDTKEVYAGEAYTTGYHGYGATDLYAVDEHLGDLAKLKEFVKSAHMNGFVVIQDQVVNHVGPYHVWANDPPTPTWFNGTLKEHLSNNWQKWTAMNPRATYQTQQRNIDGWFIDLLPDLNQRDPEVEKYLIQNSLWWLAQTGFDAIRMDTLPHVPRSFWGKWSAAVHREFPKVNILGELFDGDPALLAYFQKGKRGHDGIDTGIDTLFDFTLYFTIRDAFAKGRDIRNVSQVFGHDWLYPKPEALTSFIGNHDVPRFMAEPGATIDGLKLAQTLIMTSRGSPILYYGDEIAMPGGGDPDNRRDMPGGFDANGRGRVASGTLTADERSVLDHVIKLGKLRRDLEPLRRGRSLDLVDEPQQFAYARATDKAAVVVVINNDAKTAPVSFDVSMIPSIPKDAELIDALGTLGTIKLAGSTFRTTMPARTSAIFTLRSP